MGSRNSTVMVYGSVVALGFTAGLRSQTPLAFLALTASDGGPDLLRKRWIVANIYLSALGEMAVDKLPMTPSRLGAGPLAGRLMFGSLSGALLGRRHGAPVVAGVLTGAAGALAGSYAGYHARSYLVKSTELPDAVWAGVEDVVALALSWISTRSLA
jgi:uncharacterized membrane protein